MVYIFKLDFHPTQQLVYDDPHKHKVIAAGKGWGKTHSVTKSAAALAMTKPGSCGAVIAPYAKQAFYDFNIIKKLIPANQIEKVSERWLIIYLKNGSEITMFSAENPEAARGYAWDWVIVDEAAFCDPAIFPIIDSQVGKRNGIAWYISTPNGKGMFWDLYCQESKDPENYKSFHFTTYDNPHYPVKEIERMKKNMPEFVFRQEVMAEFIEGGVVFPHLAEIMTSEPRDPQEKHTYTIGADIASTNDFTVIKVFDDSDNHEVSHERLTNKDWGYIKQAIYTTCKYWNNATLIIDKTGVGAPVVEDLEKMDRAYPGAQKLGYLTVVPIIFSSVSKPQLYTNYIMMHENRTIHLLNEPVTKQEHEDFTAKRSQENSGYMKYSAPKGRNDDCVTSAALGAWGLSQNMGSAVIGQPEIISKSESDENRPYNMEEVAEWEPSDDTGEKGIARGHNKHVLKRFFSDEASYRAPLPVKAPANTPEQPSEKVLERQA